MKYRVRWYENTATAEIRGSLLVEAGSIAEAAAMFEKLQAGSKIDTITRED